MSDAMPKAVRGLENLYTVIIGVALSIAVVTLLGDQKALSAISLSSGALFGGFIVTLFPFYHGALRHLDEAYSPPKTIKHGALVIDFFLLFGHALAFVVLSLLIGRPSQFIWVLMIVLVVDVVWGFVMYLVSPAEHSTEAKWSLINVVFVIVAMIYMVQHQFYMQDVADPVVLAVPAALLCLLRTIIDYVWCGAFYFPK